MAVSGRASVDVVADFSKFAASFQKDLNAVLRGIKIDMSGVSGQIEDGVRKGVDRAGNQLRRMGSTAGEVFDGIAKNSRTAAANIGASFKNVGRDMASVGDQMTMSVSMPLAAAGALSINAAGNFEAAMNKVKAATESSGKEFEGLRSLAIELGSTTAFSASEAAFAMNELATAGFDTNQIMGALPGVLDMAAAGSVSLSSAAEIAAGILNGFGFKAADLGRVNDILARTFLSTATTLTDLGESFKYAGPVAKSAGLTFTEVAAAIGLMGNAGIKGTMAGTALNGAISRLLKPTNDVANKLTELGVTVTGAGGKMLPLVDIMRQLERAGADTTDMITLFGLEAGPDMMALLSQGSGALAALDSELQNAGGTAQKVATTQLAGFNGAVDELKSSLEALAIAVGDSGLLGWLTRLADKLTVLVTKISSAPPWVLRLVVVFAAVAIAIGPMLAVFGRMAVMIGEAILIFKKFGGWLTKIRPMLAGLGGPIAWVTVAVVAIGAALIYAYGHFEGFRRIVQQAMAAVGAAVRWVWASVIVPAFEWIVAGAKRVGAAVASLWRQAQPVFVAMGLAILRVWNTAIKPALGQIGAMFTKSGGDIRAFWSSSVQPALTQIMALFARLGAAVRQWWAGNGDAVIAAAVRAVGQFGSMLKAAVTGVMAVLKALVGVITWGISNVAIPVFRALIAIVRGVVDVVVWLKPVWMAVAAVVVGAVKFMVAGGQLLYSVMSTVVQGVITAVTWLWGVIQPIISGIGAVIMWLWSNVVQPAFNGIAAAVQVVIAAATWLWNTFSPVFQAIGNLVWAIWSGVFSVVFSLLKLAFAVVVGALKVLWAVWSAIFNAVGAVVMAVWQGMIRPALQAVGDVITWLWGVIQPAVQAIGMIFQWLWSAVISPVVNWISAGMSSLLGTVQGVWAGITSAINVAVSAISGAASGVTNFVNNVRANFNAMVSAVVGAINSAASYVQGLPGRIVGAVGNLGGLLYGAGQNIIQGLINGIQSMIGQLTGSISNAAGLIRGALPFSPAKWGPLSGRGDPTISGGKIISMVADGMRARSKVLADAMSDTMGQVESFDMKPLAAGALSTSTGGVTSLAAPVPAAAGSAPAVQYQITVNALDPRSASTAVIDAIQAYERGNGRGWRS